MKKTFLVSFTIVGFIFSCLAQNDRIYREVVTNEYMEYEFSKDPNFYSRRQKIEEFINVATQQEITVQYPITIPLFFHILLPEGQSKIDNKKINDQIEQLNKYFNVIDYNFEHNAMNGEKFDQVQDKIDIQFCLAQYESKPGIKSIIKNQESIFENEFMDGANGGSTIVSPEKFVNVYITELKGNMAGYAQMPGGDIKTDAIVIDPDFFGFQDIGNYAQGKTLVHLISNYFNLYSLWQKECGDDYVTDTPIHNAPNFECPGYKHITTCEGNAVEMTMNFLDNTDDECMIMFTKGQQQRFYASLIAGGSRYSLAINDAECQSGNLRARNDSKVSIFPNPTSSEINIAFAIAPQQKYKIKLVNFLGQSIFEKYYSEQIIKFSAPSNAQGVYSIIIENEGETITKRIIVTK